MEKQDICSMTISQLEQAIKEMGEPAFRAKQIFTWIHSKNVDTFAQMTNISNALKLKLDDYFYITCLNIKKRLVSTMDHTVKYLYELSDGEHVESVLMKYEHGYSICISTQVGCRMGCGFCATGLGGLYRNLTPSEMLGQIVMAQKDQNLRISNVVLMGMGEPLDNYENVLRFLELVSHPEGLNIGMRHISLSTCGLVDKIYKLIPLNPQFTLSISLHAPNDQIRDQLMPVNRKWPLAELMKACRAYTQATHRRISFEYAMIRGVNDSDECAGELARLCKGMLCHVNLIPVNHVTERAYVRSDRQRLQTFQRILIEQHINATVRRTLGSDIDASCGQLRRRVEKAERKGAFHENSQQHQ